MHIAVDARELAGRPTGVGRYLRGLLARWADDPRARRHRWTLYAHEPIEAAFGAARHLAGAGGVWWEQRTLAGALRRDRPDVLFSPGYTAPIMTDIPLVVTVHDVSYWAHPEWFRSREGARRRWVTALAARRAKTVLTVSHFSRGEIARWLGVADERVSVVYHGLTPRALPDTAREPLVLFVGSIFNRRHVPALIRGFARVARTRSALRLEIVGDDRSHPREDLARVIAEEKVTEQVALRAYVDEPTLNSLYARARAFAFLSEYEGFGLTPLEALSAGVVPLVLDTQVARETCGDAVLYVSSPDPEAVAAALEATLDDERERARVLAAAPAVLARYRWEVAASATLDALEGAAP